MSLPQHQNPNRNRMASAPYNFVPLPERVVKAVDQADTLPSHDVYLNKSGYFQVTLTTKSPLYVRCPFTLADFLSQEREEDEDLPFRRKVRNTPDFFYTHDKAQPVIPGSSLRGMLRSLLEIVSYGKVERVTDSFKIFYRAVAAAKDDPIGKPYRDILGMFGRKVRAGYLVKKENEWHVQPAMGKLTKAGYLTVREEDIPSDALPGLIRLNSENYSPQYHQVSFDGKEVKGKFSLTKIGSPPQPQFKYQGVLVCSGNMLETGGEEAQSPRKTHALVLEADQTTTRAKINAQSVEDYIDALTPFQKKAPFNERTGCLQDGRPVFYVEDEEEIIFFGHSPNFRIPAFSNKKRRARTPLDFVPQELRRPEDIDYADALFGYAKGNNVAVSQGKKAQSYASRISVTDATLQDNQIDCIWLSPQPIVPQILATPKPSAFQHYLTQQKPNRKIKLDHYGTSPPHDTVIRGHKRYWHQGNRAVLDIKEDDPQWLQNGRVKDDSTQHTQFKPVKAGVKFTFRVYFENLSDRELGALCWVLHPLGDEQKTYCHSLGMGKPLGMGAVKLDATLHLTDRPKRYSSLFDGEGKTWQTGSVEEQQLSDHTTLKSLTQAFEKHLLDDLQPSQPCNHLSDLRRIGMLLKMMEWPGFPPDSAGDQYLAEAQRPNTRYMSIRPNEYRDRFVLPDPSAFGNLTGEQVPTVTDVQETEAEEGSSGPTGDGHGGPGSKPHPAPSLQKFKSPAPAPKPKPTKSPKRVNVEVVANDDIWVTVKVLDNQDEELRFKQPYYPLQPGQTTKLKVRQVDKGRITQVAP